MKFEGFKINKKSVDKFFTKTDIDILDYESPIQMIANRLSTEIAKKVDDNIWEAVVKTEIAVNKDELVKALQYDRDQYEKGYVNGYNAGYTADKWISVEDRLPNLYTDCIVSVKTKYAWETKWNYHTDAALFKGDGVWETWNDWDEGNEVIVTHWMPLPDLPMEEEE